MDNSQYIEVAPGTFLSREDDRGNEDYDLSIDEKLFDE